MGRQDGVVAGGMEAENDGGSPRMFQSNAIGTDGNSAIGSDFERGP